MPVTMTCTLTLMRDRIGLKLYIRVWLQQLNIRWLFNYVLEALLCRFWCIVPHLALIMNVLYLIAVQSRPKLSLSDLTGPLCFHITHNLSVCHQRAVDCNRRLSGRYHYLSRIIDDNNGKLSLSTRLESSCPFTDTLHI